MSVSSTGCFLRPEGNLKQYVFSNFKGRTVLNIAFYLWSSCSLKTLKYFMLSDDIFNVFLFYSDSQFWTSWGCLPQHLAHGWVNEWTDELTGNLVDNCMHYIPPCRKEGRRAEVQQRQTFWDTQWEDRMKVWLITCPQFNYTWSGVVEKSASCANLSPDLRLKIFLLTTVWPWTRHFTSNSSL